MAQPLLTYRQHYIANIKLALPVMITQISHMMVQVADSMMVGRLGAIPLAAVSLANSAFVLPIVAIMGLSMGLTPLISIARGKNDQNTIPSLYANSFILNGINTLIITVLVFGISYLFPFMGQDEQVIPLAKPYLQLLGLSLFPVAFFFTQKQYAEGLEDTKSAMYISILSNAINVLLNYLLIFGEWGFPELGMIGAGYATLIARIIMAILFGIYVIRKKHLKLYFPTWADFRFIKSKAAHIFRVGSSIAGQMSVEAGAFAMGAIICGIYSPIDLAANQVAITLAASFYMLPVGLSAASTVRVGYFFGEENYTSLRRAAFSAYHMTFAIMTFTALIILLFREYIPFLFLGFDTDVNSENYKVALLATSLMLYAAAFQLSDGINTIGLGILRGITDVKIPSLIMFVSFWVMALPIGSWLTFSLDFGAKGIWIGYLIGLTIAAIFNYWRFYNKVVMPAQAVV